MLSSISRGAARCSTALAVTALFVMMLMTFLDVIFRSVLGQPIEAATELTRILMAVVVFSILPLMSFEGKHIAVDLVDQFLPQIIQRLSDALLSMVCGVLLFWPAERCVVLANRARDYGDVTEYLAIPTFYLAWFITLSVFLTSIVLVLRGLLGLFMLFKSDNPIPDNPAS